MRKKLSIIVAIALVLSSFTMAFAALPPDVAGTDYEESVGVLMGLGVINGYEDGTYKPERVVSRAEMAKLIIVALGLENSAGAVSSRFPDMAGATWAQGFVSMASDLGIVIGYPDGTFQPGNTVTYNEATTMILRALGYSDKSLGGEWPTNYVVKAKVLGVLEGMEGKTGGANRGDIAEMLYSALALDIGTVGADGFWKATGGDSFLKRLGAEMQDPYVITGLEESAVNLRPFVGAYATAYLNKDGAIIAVAPQTEFLTGEYDGSVFTAGDVDYSVTSAIVGANRPCFENGLQKGTCALDDHEDEILTIAVTLTGKTIKMIYSIAAWDVTEDDLFSSADALDIKEDAMLFGLKFVKDDDGAIDRNAFELIGAASLEKIKADNVVYVYADSKDHIRKIAVGTAIVTGKITRISSGGDYTIKGTAYSVTDAAVMTTLAGGTGDDVKVWLDAYGDIYLMKITSGQADNYAVALAVGNGTGSALSGFEPKISLFMPVGQAQSFTVDETQVDLAALYFSNPSTPKIWVDAPTAGTIIKYGLDDDNVIDVIEEITASATSNITLKGNFNGLSIASDAVIFTYSGTDASDEENYRVRELTDVLDMTSVNARYAVDDDSGKIAAMLILSGVTSDEKFGVVLDRAVTTSSAGYEIEFMIDGKSFIYDARRDAYDTAAATQNLYKLNFNLAGEVATLTAPISYVSVENAVINDYVLQSGGNNYTVDSDVVVYKWNSTKSVYEKSTLSNVVNAVIFDCYDEDSVYDIILIPPII